jgi:hypothetical protein
LSLTNNFPFSLSTALFAIRFWGSVQVSQQVPIKLSNRRTSTFLASVSG